MTKEDARSRVHNDLVTMVKHMKNLSLKTVPLRNGGDSEKEAERRVVYRIATFSESRLLQVKEHS